MHVSGRVYTQREELEEGRRWSWLRGKELGGLWFGASPHETSPKGGGRVLRQALWEVAGRRVRE
jgi:hypothetical protein